MRVSDLPPRVLLAAAVTVLAVVVLGAQTVLSGGDGAGEDAGGGPTTTELDASVDSTTAGDEPAVAPPRPVEVQPDWYPKRSSRYSDRSPEASITTVPPAPES